MATQYAVGGGGAGRVAGKKGTSPGGSVDIGDASLSSGGQAALDAGAGGGPGANGTAGSVGSGGTAGDAIDGGGNTVTLDNASGNLAGSLVNGAVEI